MPKINCPDFWAACAVQERADACYQLHIQKARAGTSESGKPMYAFDIEADSMARLLWHEEVALKALRGENVRGFRYEGTTTGRMSSGDSLAYQEFPRQHDFSTLEKRLHYAVAYGAAQESIARLVADHFNKEKSMNPENPRTCPPYGIPAAPAPGWQTPASAVESAKAALAQAEAALAAKEASDAFKARIEYDIGLATATVSLLKQINPDTARQCPFHVEAWAIFRKELQPLANAYGFKIVLVGDKSTATLVEV